MVDSLWSVERQLEDDERTEFEALLLHRLRSIYRANPWVVAVEVDQGAVRLAAGIKDLSCAPVLAVGARPGIGPVDESIPLISIGLPHDESFFADIGSAHVALAEPQAEHQAAVDEWDPAGVARAIGSLTSVSGTLMGRQTFGSRPAAWRALEDKLAIEEVWDQAGIPVAPSVQVDLADVDGLLGAHDRLATAHGTVWAGDNSSGWHGGGSGTYWVPDRAAVAARAQELTRFDRVRIMPFVDGVPCSIHGMVIPDGAGGTETVTFRPTEMMVLRNPAEHRFVYGRSATFWDPAPGDRAAMRTTAGMIGDQLARQVGFRGVFTVDGILGHDGFVPTEVNPRYGAALPMLHTTASGDPLSLFLLNLAVVDGALDDADLRPLGPLITASLDRNRAGSAFLHTSATPSQELHATVYRDRNGSLAATEDERASEGDRASVSAGAYESARAGESETVAEVGWGPSGDSGGLVVVTLKDVPLGPLTAPLLVELAKVLDSHWTMGLEDLEAAPRVR